MTSDTSGEADALPLPALLALAMTGFAAILTETLPAGVLPQMAAGLSVSVAAAGQSVTAYAAGSLTAAIPLTAWTAGRRRKPTLLTAIGGFFVFNTVTAVSDDYLLTLVARFLAGVAAGLAWAILAGYARRMVVDRLKGRALAIAMVGTPVALSLGVPGGTFLGGTMGWRASFLVMSVTTVILVAWVLWCVPDYPGQAAHRRLSLRDVFLTPGIRPILATILAWMTAHNILYTYVAPFAALSGLESRIDLLLFAFGVTALLGIVVTGLLVDRMLRRLVLTSLVVFGVVALALGLAAGRPVIVTVSILFWGVSFGGAATLLQTAAGDAAGDGADLANAMITTVWNLAIAAGGLVGGVLLHVVGAGAFPWATLAMAGAAVAIATLASGAGFKPGPRGHA